jgi:hypothetical protein
MQYSCASWAFLDHVRFFWAYVGCNCIAQTSKHSYCWPENLFVFLAPTESVVEDDTHDSQHSSLLVACARQISTRLTTQKWQWLQALPGTSTRILKSRQECTLNETLNPSWLQWHRCIKILHIRWNLSTPKRVLSWW